LGLGSKETWSDFSNFSKEIAFRQVKMDQFPDKSDESENFRIGLTKCAFFIARNNQRTGLEQIKTEENTRSHLISLLSASERVIRI
jgi:hypothetical protein